MLRILHQSDASRPRVRRADAHLPEGNWSQTSTPELRARNMRLLFRRDFPLVCQSQFWLQVFVVEEGGDGCEQDRCDYV